MKEEIKITGKGSLHNKSFGIIKDDIKKNTYDSKLDQYCINGQWEIPYHREHGLNMDMIKNELKIFLCKMKTIKQFFVKNQEYENSGYSRDIEKSITNIIKSKENKNEKL